MTYRVIDNPRPQFGPSGPSPWLFLPNECSKKILRKAWKSSLRFEGPKFEFCSTHASQKLIGTTTMHFPGVSGDITILVIATYKKIKKNGLHIWPVFAKIGWTWHVTIILYKGVGPVQRVKILWNQHKMASSSLANALLEQSLYKHFAMVYTPRLTWLPQSHFSCFSSFFCIQLCI